MKRFVMVLLSVLLALGAVRAQATELILVGGVDYTKYQSSTASAKEKPGFGGGLLFDLGLSRSIAFEIGGIYATRAVQGVGSTTVEFPYIQVPAAFRLWLSRHIVLTLGGYYARGIVKESNFAASGFEKTDYGATGGLGFMLPLGRTVAFTIDGRYNYGFADITTDGSKIGWQGIQGLAGFSFWLGR